MINKTNLRKSKKESNKGITLIALVITIIVLLILAGVSIATLTGENGILTKANTAKNQTIEAEEKEQISLAYSTVMADKLHSNSGNDLTVTADELKQALDNQNADATVEKDSNLIKVTFTKSKNVYTIDGETGEIKGIENGGSQKQVEPEKIPTVEKQDKICNIWDMASNDFEWTTETSADSDYPCVGRGGFGYSASCTSSRIDRTTDAYNDGDDDISFRLALYL